MSLFLNTLNQGATYVRRAKLLSELKKMDDHLLRDTGFSRELLNRGVTAYPWRINNTPVTTESYALSAKTHTAKPVQAARIPHFSPAG